MAVALPRGRLAALASHEEGIAEQVWDRRQGDADAAAKKFRNRLDEQRRLKSALLRAKLNGEISQADYALANTEFDYEIAVIEARLQNAQANHVTRAAFLRFANAMLLDVAGAWQRAGAEQKVRVQNLLFQNGLHYSQEYRKFEHLNPCLFNTMEEVICKNWWLASPTGFEPVLPP
ncbi:MAG TPA: hypothetical protein VFA40_03780 [Terriglobales bacterium]|nr:hypothetical protein [Terriglobales bacterium]